MNEYIRVNPDRILWCCNKYGINEDVLAQKLSISENKLNEILNYKDNKGITFNQLEKLSDFFGESLLFFINNEPVQEEKVLTPQFRTMESQVPNIDLKVKKIIDNVVSQHELYLSLLSDLDEDVSNFNPIEFSDNNDIQKKAYEIRKWLGMSHVKKMEFKNYRELIEDKGILVFLSSGYKGAWKLPADSKIAGFSYYHEKVPVIFVKKDNDYSDNQAVFTLFHELSHILLHKKTIIDSDDYITSDTRLEKEANKLAAHILVTDSMLSSIDEEEKPIEVSDFKKWLMPLTEKYSISADVVLIRLIEVGKVTQSEYNEFRNYRKNEYLNYLKSSKSDQKNISRRRYLEPKQRFGERYVRVVINALHNNLVTLSKASNYLDGIKINAIKELERSMYG